LPVSHRLSYIDEGLEVLTRAFTNERFSFRGKRYDFQGVCSRPDYMQSGVPPLRVAALAEAGALRAARFGTNLLPKERGRDRSIRGMRR
jgi:alkanesulfonate monooxygenase SsuD/methylene tetrahydromethanopterin reductase-like flavin-dependent oxidoreductase (luciferase family)